MTRSIVGAALIFLILPGGLLAQQQTQVVRPGISPVPIWPANGDTTGVPAERYVFIDPQTNEWVVSYLEDFNRPQISRRVTLRFGSHRQVEPIVVSQTSRQEDGRYLYTYTIHNSGNARTAINKWTLLVPAPDARFQAQHGTWVPVRKENTDVRDLLAAASRLKVVEWNGSDGIGALGASTGFTIRSDNSPGFTTASFSGRVTTEYTPQVAATLPKAVAEQVQQVLQPLFDHQVRIILGPRFPVGAPQIVVVDNFHFGISALAREGSLKPDSAFVKETLTVLRDFLASGGALPFTVNRLGFLSKASPGLESEIAAALRLSLLQ